MIENLISEINAEAMKKSSFFTVFEPSSQAAPNWLLSAINNMQLMGNVSDSYTLDLINLASQSFAFAF